MISNVYQQYAGDILESITEGVIVHDLQRKIILFSKGAQRLTGLLQNDVLGRNCHDIFPGKTLCGAACAVESEGVNVDRIERHPYSALYTTPDGKNITLNIARAPLKDENGNVIGLILLLNDKTLLVKHIHAQLEQTDEYHGIIGRDYKMQLIFDLIRDLSDSDFSVVISGESGTGKELVARAIHAESARANNLFVPINCGALPEGTLESELFGHVRGSFTGAIRDKKGRFELADNGTIFLDEVGELPLATQVKLLRVLQEGTFEAVGDEKARKVDVRVICATNRNLKDLVAKGMFREDLYYRLAVVPIELPPLRERKNDIELLATRFLSQVALKLSRKNIHFSQEAITMLTQYAWPGNVRQLQNAIQFAMVKCRDGAVLSTHLPPEMAMQRIQSISGELVDGLKKVGRKPKLSNAVVELAIKKAGGNKAKAARILGVGRATLYNFLEENTITVQEE